MRELEVKNVEKIIESKISSQWRGQSWSPLVLIQKVTVWLRWLIGYSARVDQLSVVTSHVRYKFLIATDTNVAPGDAKLADL
jgi:hypothetical protein